jgi:simple sugar transport system permease protein
VNAGRRSESGAVESSNPAARSEHGHDDRRREPMGFVLPVHEGTAPAPGEPGSRPPVPGSPGTRPARLTWRDVPAVSFGRYVLSIGAALAISALLVMATDGSPSAVLSALLDGSLRSPGAWGLTLTTMAPLLLVAIGTIVATRAGLVNIGQEGQVLIGAAFAAYLAVRLPGPGWIVIPASLAFAFVGGGLWAAIAAALRAWRKVPEVLSTLLLTFVSFSLVTYGLRQRWLIGDRDTTRVNRVNTGEQLPAHAKLPDLVIFGNSIDVSVFLAIGLAFVLALMMTRSYLGTRIDMVGLNPRAAQRFGVAQGPLTAAVLIGSGAFAGVAGAVLLHGGASGDRLAFGFSGNVGWDGLLVALLARNRVLLAIPMAFVFAMLRTGSSFLAATGVDRKVTDVVQALLVLALLLPPALAFVAEQRRARRAAGVASSSATTTSTTSTGAA